MAWLSYVAFFGQFSKYCFAVGSSRSKARKCKSAGYGSLMGRLCFLLNTNMNRQGFISPSGSYWCEVSILLDLVTFLHFHEILPHCDPKHIFPFLLALVISQRKPRRFYTYTHELLDCNIATHTFFST